MKKTVKDILIERRSYIRIRTPLSITYAIPGNSHIHSITTKDISANGVRFENQDKKLKVSDVIDIKMGIPDTDNQIRMKGVIKWKRPISLEDNAPFDIGVEFSQIAEDDKNAFLKFLCDCLYTLTGG